MSSSDKKRSRKSKLVPRTFVEVENDGIEVVQAQKTAAAVAFEVDVKVESGDDDDDDWCKKLEEEATAGRAGDDAPPPETPVSAEDTHPLDHFRENHPNVSTSLVQFWCIKLERLIADCHVAIHTFQVCKKRNEVLYYCDTCSRYFDVQLSFKQHFFKHKKVSTYRVIPQVTTRQLVLTAVEENKDEDEDDIKRRMYLDFITTAVGAVGKNECWTYQPLKIHYYKCYVCSKSFEHLRPFIEHLLAYYGHENTVFAVERILQSNLFYVKAKLPHQKETQENFPLYSANFARLMKCLMCREGFESQAALDKHQNPIKVDPLQVGPVVNGDCVYEALAIRRTTEARFTCGCGQLLMESLIEEHRAVCNLGASLPLVCCVCKYTTKKPGELRLHQMERHTVRSDEFLLQRLTQCGCLARYCGKRASHHCPLRKDCVACKDCELTFQNELFLRVHRMATQFGQRCELCGVFLPRSCMLAEHRALRHDGGALPAYSCPRCRHTYLDREVLYEHINQAHKSMKPRYYKSLVPWKRVVIKDLNSPVEILSDSEYPAPWSFIPSLFPEAMTSLVADDDDADSTTRVRGITELVRKLNKIKKENSVPTDNVPQDRNDVWKSMLKLKAKNTEVPKVTIHIPGISELVKKLKKRKHELISETTDGQDRAKTNTPDKDIDDSVNEESSIVIAKPETDHDYFKVQIKEENIETDSTNVDAFKNRDEKVPMEIIENIVSKDNEAENRKASEVEPDKIAVKQESDDSAVPFELARVKTELIEMEIDEQTPSEEFLVNLKSEVEQDTGLSNVFQPSEKFRYTKTAKPQEPETIRIKAEPVDLEEERIILQELEYDDTAESIDDFIQNNSEITTMEIKPEIYYESDDSPTKTQTKRYPRVPVEPLVLTCSKCGATFMELKLYLNHTAVHGNPKLSCPDCHQPMDTMSKLRMHVLVHVRRNYVPVYTIHHEDDSDSKLTFSCNKCGGVVDKEYFWSHWETHLVFGEVKKPVKAATAEPEENEEEEEDDGLKAYPGDNQPGVDLLPDVMTLLINLLQSITGTMNEKFCIVCEKFFMRNYDLKRHIIEHMLKDARANWPKNGKALACQICNAKYKKSHLYKLHMRGHGKLPIYKCEMCTKSFGDSSNFAKHKKIHGLQTMHCDMCSRKYRSKEMLIKHIERHARQAPQKCKLCDRSFSFANELKKHMKLKHVTGSKSYACGICGERYPSIKEKWDHEFAVHGETKRQFNCEYCPEKFRLQRLYKQHLNQAHKKALVIPAKTNNRSLLRRNAVIQNVAMPPGPLFYIKCPFCEEIFKQKAEYYIHVTRVHEAQPTEVKQTGGVEAQVDSDDDRLSIDMDKVKQEASSESENEELRRAVRLIM
ncbi:unnamed protein product [Plutella xylostella]|uniref:(diamondback moth) hypothetical protein n=1 Tax=Plutella xylostella TaxID=51655 RepID=A0A8S4D3W2_PLUXY|nr:unnamed protein product [Plutella xylostella]